jgi:hypothetical protein
MKTLYPAEAVTIGGIVCSSLDRPEAAYFCSSKVRGERPLSISGVSSSGPFRGKDSKSIELER